MRNQHLAGEAIVEFAAPQEFRQLDGRILPEVTDRTAAAESSERHGQTWYDHNRSEVLVLPREGDQMLGEFPGGDERMVFARREQLGTLPARPQGNQGDKLLDLTVRTPVEQSPQEIIF